mmetsp:Transcript_9513/g.25282  ORF Transcript_9513/g.25282 Transcript_9513/m.25282 type:complete len:200 (-) Transcript_9513:281-880(-)
MKARRRTGSWPTRSGARSARRASRRTRAATTCPAPSASTSSAGCAWATGFARRPFSLLAAIAAMASARVPYAVDASFHTQGRARCDDRRLLQVQPLRPEQGQRGRPERHGQGQARVGSVPPLLQALPRPRPGPEVRHEAARGHREAHDGAPGDDFRELDRRPVSQGGQRDGHRLPPRAQVHVRLRLLPRPEEEQDEGVV